ncbi:PIN domain-containing protein [Geminocystis herdmanii]|uniref:PIN domain-containing protein n=1 Tax=Geminocystis herdmanii TaxID=669359 RepID=UPI000349DD56|nr:PIN domain-containing protein [Geminocystis herdmanii]
MEWLSSQNIIGISVISVEEIYYGLNYKNAQKQLNWFRNFLDYRCQIFVITPQIAQRCGELRAKLRQQGITRTQADLLIASTAYEYQLSIVTRNTKDFTNCDINIFNPFLEQNPEIE